MSIEPEDLVNEIFPFFENLPSFTMAVEAISGIEFDFQSVANLATDFLQATDKYMILNIKGFGEDDPNNLLFLTEYKAFLFAKKPAPPEVCKPFEDMCSKPFGRSTVLTFATLKKVLDSYKNRLEAFVRMIKEVEQNFDSKKYRDLSFELERFGDRLEEFHDLLIRLQERGYREVETKYISFDYKVLIAESLTLQGRNRRRLSLLKEVARDHEMQVTTELNRRIERLNDVVRKLTAITVILMLPTLIASHFGMNFQFMPELHVSWAYPAVIGVQLLLVGVCIIIFKKIGWL